MTHFWRNALVLMMLLLGSGSVQARALHVSDSSPKAEAIYDGRNAQYVIRFDGLVDHEASRMDITKDGRIVQTLVPIRDSEPDVLAASAPALTPGRYQLHWRVKSAPDGEFSDGLIPFTIAR